MAEQNELLPRDRTLQICHILMADRHSVSSSRKTEMRWAGPKQMKRGSISFRRFYFITVFIDFFILFEVN